MVSRRDVRFILSLGLTLGLCAAVTMPSRTSSAKYGTGGTSTGGTMSAGARTGGGTSSASGATAVSAAAPLGVDAGARRSTWRESEIVLAVDPSYLAMPYAKQALEGALLAWTSTADQLPKVTLRYVGDSIGVQSEAANLADHRIFFAPLGDRRAKGALAITLVTADEDNNTIMDADILVNGGHLFTDVVAAGQKSAQAGAYDLQNVITHELGHWFGLDEDTANTEATMYAYVFPGETKKRDLDASDINSVQLAYWQADNPSENRGCSLIRTETSDSPLGVGWLAAAIGLVFWRNRRTWAQLEGQPCRQQS